MAEKSRIYFIKASADKYKNFICQYNKYINDFIVIMRELSKFCNNKTNNFIPIEKFVSFNDDFMKKIKIK